MSHRNRRRHQSTGQTPETGDKNHQSCQKIPAVRARRKQHAHPGQNNMRQRTELLYKTWFGKGDRGRGAFSNALQTQPPEEQVQGVRRLRAWPHQEHVQGVRRRRHLRTRAMEASARSAAAVPSASTYPPPQTICTVDRKPVQGVLSLCEQRRALDSAQEGGCSTHGTAHILPEEPAQLAVPACDVAAAEQPGGAAWMQPPAKRRRRRRGR